VTPAKRNLTRFGFGDQVKRATCIAEACAHRIAEGAIARRVICQIAAPRSLSDQQRIAGAKTIFLSKRISGLNNEFLGIVLVGT
jgi:hypothetical protein